SADRHIVHGAVRCACTAWRAAFVVAADRGDDRVEPGRIWLGGTPAGAPGRPVSTCGAIYCLCDRILCWHSRWGCGAAWWEPALWGQGVRAICASGERAAG